jgi:hypothetical protein
MGGIMSLGVGKEKGDFSKLLADSGNPVSSVRT